MNEMKHFFTTSSVGTISECLNGEKLLNASRDAKGNTLLTFESAYEGYSDLLTIMPDGSAQSAYSSVTRSSGPRPSTTTRP